MLSLQDLIHKFEGGGSGRPLRYVLVFLLVAGLFVRFNYVSYRNLNSQEAMDSAQLARNIAEGRGYTTSFVRPFSIHLVQQKYLSQHGGVKEAGMDIARIKDIPHPDLANPPVYPVMLAGLMKVMPFRYEIDVKRPFWSVPAFRPTTDMPRQFWRYQPDFLISLFNQLLLVGVVIITFNVARGIFDRNVAWLSAALLIGCEFLWRFATSGQSTTLLMLIFMAMVQCLVWIEREEREPRWRHTAQTWLAIVVGLLLGLGMLTRYSFGWLVIPVLVYLGIFCALRRVPILVLVSGVFLLAVTPWIVRNYAVSGTPFGTAGYAIMEGVGPFADHRLQRSLDPEFTGVGMKLYSFKLLNNLRPILQNEIPKLGGSWMTACFLAGLLLGFRNPALRRLRYFLLGTMVLFVIVQALCRTQLSEDSPEFNSENLLALAVPLVFVYGCGLFFQLLDQMNLRIKVFRYGVIVLFSIVMCLPMIFALTVNKISPLAFPPAPYFPTTINAVSEWMKENELIMSDTPWAVAWYGKRQSVWFTLDVNEEFYKLNDQIKQVRAIYLTPQTMDGRFLTDWVLSGRFSWPDFVLETLKRDRIPPNFPLRSMPVGFLPYQLFLADRDRWTADSINTNAIRGPIKE